MSIVDVIETAFQLVIALWVLSFLIRLIRPETSDFFSRTDQMIADAITSIPYALSNIWFATASVLYFVGNFSVLILLAFGVFLVGYSVLLHWPQVQFSADGLYQLARLLVDERAAWSGATILVAATVAIGHMWKLNLDKKQYYEKRMKELREEREAAHAKARASFSRDFPTDRL